MQKTSNQPKILTGKQLIKHVSAAVKSGLLQSDSFDCTIGAWGDDFPTLTLKMTTGDKTHAWLRLEMLEKECFGGDNEKLEIVDFVRIDSLVFGAENAWAETKVAGNDIDKIKDITLLKTHLKGIFDGLRITTYQDDDRYYQGESYKLRK